MKNYFQILGLEPNASESEIRRAYRQKAKLHHPDVNTHADAHHHFMELNEAYEFLADNAQRTNYVLLLNQDKMDRAEQERRERVYKLWVEHQQRQTRYRSAVAADYMNAGKKVPYGRLYTGTNAVLNVVFLFVFLVMVIIPVWRYIHQLTLPVAQQRPAVLFIMPAFVGLLFIVVGFYYWFILKTDKD